MTALRTTWRALALLAAAWLLAGCAAQTAFREGQQLVAEGRSIEGMARLEEASRLDPGDARYRMAVLQTRERYINAKLDASEAARSQGKLDQAEHHLREALAMQPSNERALADLRAIGQQRRAEAWIREADSLLARKDPMAARGKLAQVLAELPGHEGARSMLLSIERDSRQAAPETALSAAYRKLITIEFKDVPLRTVFEVISRTSGLNFLFDKDVKTDQKTSIFLKNSTIEAAVNLSLLTNQLDQRVLDANTVLIYPNTQAKQKDYQPLSVRSFYLANAEAKTVAATLKTILKSRDVVVDEKLNLLIVRDSPEAIRLAAKLIAMHDVPEPEVMLEVEILEVKRTQLLDLGIRWPDQLSLAPLGTASGGAISVADLRNLNSSRVSAAVGPVTLIARNTDTDANILANPRIRARNREKAKILIGERVPVITTTSTTIAVTESVNYVDVGLKLDVEPTIYLDGEVAIKVALEVSNIISQVQTKSGTVAYQIGTRNAQTVLRLRDAENQVLAGLISDEDRRSANKVPVLGEVPVVGRLFGSQLDDASKTEIVLSITPRIVRNVKRPDESQVEFESGTENSLGSRPGSSPLPAAPVASPPQGPSSAPRAAPSPVSSAAQAATTTAANTNEPVAAAVGSTTALRLQGPIQVKVGDLFAVQVVIDADQPVTAAPFVLGFEPSMVQAVSVAEGDFLRQGSAPTSFASRVEAAGQVVVTSGRPGITGATGSGTIATVNLRAVAALNSETKLTVVSATPVGPAARPIPVVMPAPLAIRIAP